MQAKKKGIIMDQVAMGTRMCMIFNKAGNLAMASFNSPCVKMGNLQT